jgi:DNA-directed RNA polymerase subunit RPC12/RpoP
MKNKRKYLIFKCIRCGKVNLTKSINKTKTCTYCGYRNKLSKAKILASVPTPKEARYLAAKIKAKQK